MSVSMPTPPLRPTATSISLSSVILQTILGRLAVLFLTGAGGDVAAARQAAVEMLDSFAPQTVHELRLAAEIISFSFHALEALAQAADPLLPPTRVLRLRGSAVSLSRDAHKSQRRLEQLQQARRAGVPIHPAEAPPAEAPPAEAPPAEAPPAEAPPAEAPPAEAHVAAASCTDPDPGEASPDQPQPLPPRIDNAIALVETTREVAAAAQSTGLTWTQAYQQRQRAKRIAENLKRNRPPAAEPTADPAQQVPPSAASSCNLAATSSVAPAAAQQT